MFAGDVSRAYIQPKQPSNAQFVSNDDSYSTDSSSVSSKSIYLYMVYPKQVCTDSKKLRLLVE